MKFAGRRYSFPFLIAGLSLAAAMAVAGCENSVKTSTSPSPVKCQVSLTLGSPSIEAAGGAGAITVATQPECAWTASADVSWITNFTPASGQGPGDVRFQVAANPNPGGRSGQVTLNGISVRVSQSGAGCQYDINPRSQSFSSAGGTGVIGVTAAAGCAWSASGGDSWAVITAGGGNGDGTVTFTVSAKTGVARIATFIIADQTFVVTQQAPSAPTCNYSIAPTSQSMAAGGGTTNVAITADPGCSWTAASNVSWLAVSGVGTGVGNGSVTISAQPNTGTTRVGTMTLAGRTFTVTQTGSCALSLAPSNQSIGSGSGSGFLVGVTTAAGCAWTASTTDSWITLAIPVSGNGNGTVSFSAAANTGPARTGTISVNGQTHTVNQSGSCALSINPSSQSAPSGGGAATPIAVTTAAGCAWTATTTDSWITISNPASGSGNGTVNFSVSANTGAARTGTITIGAQTHTVNQAGSCASSINPASQSVPVGGGAGTPIAVTAPAGCAWTATTAATWITITAPASGSGNGTVNFTAAANTGGARSGTISVAGQTHTVNQAASCPTSINPASQSAASGGGNATPIAVTAPAGCAWTATTTDTWLTIANPASGTGNGTVNFSVGANTGPARTGTLTVAGQTHAVNQASGCTFSISPNSRNFNKNAVASSNVTVTAGAGCTWTAVANDPWITIVSGASGSGNGTVTFSLTANGGPSDRTGTITIAGRTFTIDQSH